MKPRAMYLGHSRDEIHPKSHVLSARTSRRPWPSQALPKEH